LPYSPLKRFVLVISNIPETLGRTKAFRCPFIVGNCSSEDNTKIGRWFVHRNAGHKKHAHSRLPGWAFSRDTYHLCNTPSDEEDGTSYK
jgi:hypothetical protein